jgi:uncharacterized protein (DUF4213/DUF364 family)
MSVRQKLKEISLLSARDLTVNDVRIGLGYTAVQLDNGQVGVAYTFHRNAEGGCSVFKGLRPLAGRHALELLAMFDSKDKIESAVALATCNAIFNAVGKRYTGGGDVIEHLDVHPYDQVGMVGNFAPLIPFFREKGVSLKIFEQIDKAKGVLLPEAEAYKHLPRCQMALITSTAIINHTVDDLLEAARSCREVILLGASTPFVPEAFADTPVTMLSGVVVIDPPQILRIVSEGGGMRFFKNYIQKANWRLADSSFPAERIQRNCLD